MFAPYLTKLILNSRARPAMYWGDNSVVAIAREIDGFNHALHVFAPERSNELFPKLAFTFYVAARLKRVVGGHAWYTFLVETYRDDGAAQRKFFQLFEEFASTATIVAKRRHVRIVKYPKVRGYFVVALPALEWGQFRHVKTLALATQEFHALLRETPNPPSKRRRLTVGKR